MPSVKRSPELVKSSTPESIDSTALNTALKAMNAEFCIIDAMPAVAQIPTLANPELRIYSRPDITQMLCADRFADGQPVANKWFSWPGKRRVKSLTYAPGKPQFFDNQLNTWVPGPLKPLKGDISVFNRYLDHIFASESTFRPWFTAWLAYQFQFPGVKLHSAVVFWSSETATGKSRFGYLMSELFGHHNFAEINEAELHGRFNFWADRKQFVMGEEIKGSNSEKQADYIKTLITRKHVNIDTKNTKQYTIPDCINYFFTSNRDKAFHLDPQDRRFFVHELAPTKLGKLSTEISKWLQAGGASALLHYLTYEVDLTLPVLNGEPFDPYGDAPQTNARKAMIEASRDEAEVWLDDFRDAPRDGYALASAEELYTLFKAVYRDSRVPFKTFANACGKRFTRVYNGHALKCSDGERRRLYLCDSSHKSACENAAGASLITQYEAQVTLR